MSTIGIFGGAPQPAPKGMIYNAAGGLVFALSDWKRLDRFLILGTEGGTYYVDERKLTAENLAVVARCIKADRARTAARIVEVSTKGLAFKPEPAIYALAMCMKESMQEVYELDAIYRVCRTGTHLFQLAAACKMLGVKISGPAKRKAFGKFYTEQDLEWLANTLIKYQSREGWSHRDILRLSHVRPATPDEASVLRWAARGWKPEETANAAASESMALRQIAAFEAIKPLRDVKEAVKLITTYNLPRECVPTELLNAPEVWDALLHAGKHGMPITAMIRNLNKMSAVGLLTQGSEAQKFIVNKLGNVDNLKFGRVHPLRVLAALRTYAKGKGEKGSLTWMPNQKVVDALDAAFYASFATVEPTGKRMLIGVDCSGSMAGGSVAGLDHVEPAEAAATMALVLLATEPNAEVVGFDDRSIPLAISPKMRINDATAVVKRAIRGGTNCSVPIAHAIANKMDVDLFVILTDDQHWAGLNPDMSMKKYREARVSNAKLASVCLVASNGTIADPTDAGHLSTVGLSPDVPEVIRKFAKDEI